MEWACSYNYMEIRNFGTFKFGRISSRGGGGKTPSLPPKERGRKNRERWKERWGGGVIYIMLLLKLGNQL